MLQHEELVQRPRLCGISEFEDAFEGLHSKLRQPVRE